MVIQWGALVVDIMAQVVGAYGGGGGRALIGAWALTRGNAVFTKVVVVSGGYLSEPRSGKEVATSTSVNGTLF